MVEYALLVSLIAVVSIGAIKTMGSATGDKLGDVVVAIGDDYEAGPGSGGTTPGPGGTTPTTAPGPGGTTPTTSPTTTSTTTPATTTTTTPATTTTAPTTTSTTTPATTTTTKPDEPVVPGSSVASTTSGGSFYWWNATKDGGDGAWKASATYQNDWIRHQYLTLEVTRVDENGKKTTITVNSFYVPAGGSSTYELWDNSLSVHKDSATGTVSVSVKVVAIQTSDEAWKTVSYTTEGPSTVVAAPKTP